MRSRSPLRVSGPATASASTPWPRDSWPRRAWWPRPGGLRSKEAMLTQIPLGRFGLPEAIVEAVAYLMSDQAGYVTGFALRNDGARSPWSSPALFVHGTDALFVHGTDALYPLEALRPWCWVDRNRADTHLARGAERADRDLSAVCDETLEIIIGRLGSRRGSPDNRSGRSRHRSAMAHHARMHRRMLPRARWSSTRQGRECRTRAPPPRNQCGYSRWHLRRRCREVWR